MQPSPHYIGKGSKDKSLAHVVGASGSKSVHAPVYGCAAILCTLLVELHAFMARCVPHRAIAGRRVAACGALPGRRQGPSLGDSNETSMLLEHGSLHCVAPPGRRKVGGRGRRSATGPEGALRGHWKQVTLKSLWAALGHPADPITRCVRICAGFFRAGKPLQTNSNVVPRKCSCAAIGRMVSECGARAGFGDVGAARVICNRHDSVFLLLLIWASGEVRTRS